MKIICSKNNLLKSVNISLKAVPSKTTMPILECILMDATTNQIKFTTNDMELGIETIVEGHIEEKGMVALDAKIFYEIIRRLPDNDVTITTDSNFVATITCEKAKFTIPGKAGEDFAYLPVIEKDESLTLSQFTLKEMIRQTIFSIAVNENNRLMTGELFEIKDNCLKIVSLDGHRISIRKMPLKKEYSDRKIVVPGKTLSEISKILSGEIDDQVSIYFTKNHILFEFDQTMVVSRLIEGEYFRIDQMLSSDYDTKVSVNKKEFLDILYEQLSGQMPEGNVAAHVQYYRNYIEEEQRKGRSEDDILNELGDPHLIARTLLDTEAAASGNPQTTEYYSESYNGHSSGYNGYENFDSGHGKVKQHSFHLDLTTWYGKLAVILIAAVVIILLCTVLSVLIPIMIVAGVILYVFRLRKR